MEVIIKPYYWTKVKELRTHCGGGLDAAYINGWQERITEATGIKFRTNKTKNQPSREEVLEAIKQCKTLSQLRHKFKPYYRRALELGMQKEIEKKLIVMNPESLYR